MQSVRPRYATRHRHTITSILKWSSAAWRLSAAPPAFEESEGGLLRGEFALIPPLAYKAQPGMERHSTHGGPCEPSFPAMKKKKRSPTRLA
jgi:hypothetical protein